MFNRGPSGTVQEGDPGLAPQAEPFLLQITHQTIQEGYNTKEYQKYQKTSPLVLHSYLESPTRGHGVPNANT